MCSRRRETGRLWHHCCDLATDLKAPETILAERESVLPVLHEEAPQLRARGIARLSLFGSIARGEAGPKATSTS